MGQQVTSVLKKLNKFFEYPVKRKPICFYRQEDFTPTGEPIMTNLLEEKNLPPTDYDKVVDLFFKRLAEQRQHNQEIIEDQELNVEKVTKKFPGWSEVAIANLHSLFLLFDHLAQGLISYDDFASILESLGDQTSMNERKDKFYAADVDGDGWIDYEEFLALLYNFHPQEDSNNLTGLAHLCNEVANNIQFVSDLTVGEQLEYGLF